MVWHKFRKLFSRGKEMFREEQADVVNIKIDDLAISMSRGCDPSVPHEFSVFVPYVKMSIKYFQDGQLWCEKDLILNSLTIVHAPRHPLVGGSQVQAGPPGKGMGQKMD